MNEDGSRPKTKTPLWSPLRGGTVGARPFPRSRAAFSLIELMVVVAVLGLLIAMITVTAARAIDSAKRRNTEQTMANVLLAIETFSNEDPLRLAYDLKDLATFGPYPPYQLANYNKRNTVAWAVEPHASNSSLGQKAAEWDYNRNNLLSDRLWRDLGQGQGNKADWVRLGGTGQKNEQDGNDDIRSLYAYLRAFSPASLEQIPKAALAPINPSRQPDMINPSGGDTEPGRSDSTWVDVLGIVDGWGVPLDYMLYVKLEWGLKRDQDGTYEEGYRVVERRPVLRSRGVDRETYDAWLASAPDGNSPFNNPERWIFSSPLPKPWYPWAKGDGRTQTGKLLYNDGGSMPSLLLERGGWARAVGLEAHGRFDSDYGYRPIDDPKWPSE